MIFDFCTQSKHNGLQIQLRDIKYKSACVCKDKINPALTALTVVGSERSISERQTIVISVTEASLG